jgi:hypothetical protein
MLIVNHLIPNALVEQKKFTSLSSFLYIRLWLINATSQLMLPDEDQRNQPTKVAGRRSTQPANKSCRTS